MASKYIVEEFEVLSGPYKADTGIYFRCRWRDGFVGAVIDNDMRYTPRDKVVRKYLRSDVLGSKLIEESINGEIRNQAIPALEKGCINCGDASNQ